MRGLSTPGMHSILWAALCNHRKPYPQRYEALATNLIRIGDDGAVSRPHRSFQLRELVGVLVGTVLDRGFSGGEEGRINTTGGGRWSLHCYRPRQRRCFQNVRDPADACNLLPLG